MSFSRLAPFVLLGLATTAWGYETPKVKVADPPTTISKLKVDIKKELCMENIEGCSNACEFLLKRFPEKLHVRGSESYTVLEADYWSVQQQSASSACRLTPSDAKDISLALLVARATSCKFAVKSGGRFPNQGTSNIPDGLTIDFPRMKKIEVSKDRETVHAEPGNWWKDMYEFLDPQELTVVGGRVSSSIGGLLLGGGISFLSGSHGFSCDNVRNYEVVFADGSVNNNFGIITRFDLVAHRKGKLYVGGLLFLEQASSQVLQAYSNFAREPVMDPKKALIVSYAHVSGHGTFIAVPIHHLDPIPEPLAFREFITIQPCISNTLRVASHAELAYEIQVNICPELKVKISRRSAKAFTDHDSSRTSFRAMSFRENIHAMTKMADAYKEAIKRLEKVEGLTAVITFQPFTQDMLIHSESRGGNSLGLNWRYGPITHVLVQMTWTNSKDDELVFSVSKGLTDRCIEISEEFGVEHPFVYMNYAGVGQDPIKGYGEKNAERMRIVSKKYDPEQVFQKLQPGHHKLY